jgi:hypothetical protein
VNRDLAGFALALKYLPGVRHHLPFAHVLCACVIVFVALYELRVVNPSAAYI